VTVWIKRPAGPDQEVQPMMDRTDRRQDKDRIVARGRAGTVRDIADLEIRNDFPAFEREITKVDFPMRTVDPARLWFRMTPARLAPSHSHSPGGYLLGLTTNYTEQIRKIEFDFVFARFRAELATATVGAAQQPAMHEPSARFACEDLDLASHHSL
jgi:hypothetical protein